MMMVMMMMMMMMMMMLIRAMTFQEQGNIALATDSKDGCGYVILLAMYLGANEEACFPQLLEHRQVVASVGSHGSLHVRDLTPPSVIFGAASQRFWPGDSCHSS